MEVTVGPDARGAVLAGRDHQLLKAPIVPVWDRLNADVSHAMRRLFVERERLTAFLLPACNPHLDPVQGKSRACGRMPSSARPTSARATPHGMETLVRNRLKRLRYRPDVLNGHIAGTGLVTSIQEVPAPSPLHGECIPPRTVEATRPEVTNMSALPHEPSPQASSDPHQLEHADGPQTLAELRDALEVISPEALTAFNARLDSATFGFEQAEVIAKARRTVAFSNRTEVAADATASMDGTAGAQPVEDLWAHLDVRDSAS